MQHQHGPALWVVDGVADITGHVAGGCQGLAGFDEQGFLVHGGVDEEDSVGFA